MNILSNHITKELRVLNRFLLVILSIIFGFNAKAEVEVIEYFEERFDVSDFISDDILKILCKDIDGQNSKNETLDLGNIPDGKNLIYIHKLYGDTLHERYERREVQKMVWDDGMLLQRGSFSRLSNVNFDRGLILDDLSKKVKLPYRYSDLMTIENSDGTKAFYNIDVTFNRENFGTVILAPGDTINNLKRYITEYEHSNRGEENISANSGVRFNYKNIRFLSDDRAFPVVEIIIITTPDDESYTVTIYREKSDKHKSPKHIEDIFKDQLQSIVISDISGRIVYLSKSNELENIQYPNLPSGWYIVTQYFNSRTISEKKFISTSTNGSLITGQ